jgi:hypothetical protein
LLAAEDNSLVAAIKATYLYKFVPFIQWPGAAQALANTAPMTFCVVRDERFADVLDKAVAGQRIGERPIVVRRPQTADRDSQCEILYIGGADAPQAARDLATVRGTPVLTVTDSILDPGNKGIINFVIDNNRVRFEIDNHAAAENGLVISSKLLSLALAVRPRT